MPVMALDASSNGLEALPLAAPGPRLVLHGLMDLRLAHNCLKGDLAAFASLRWLVHLGAFIVTMNEIGLQPCY